MFTIVIFSFLLLPITILFHVLTTDPNLVSRVFHLFIILMAYILVMFLVHLFFILLVVISAILSFTAAFFILFTFLFNNALLLIFLVDQVLLLVLHLLLIQLVLLVFVFQHSSLQLFKDELASEKPSHKCLQFYQGH